MFKLKEIDFDKIRSMVDAAEKLVEADMEEDAISVLHNLAVFISNKE